METLAVWLSEWVADLPGQNWRGAGSSCKLLAFLWTEDWKRLHRHEDSALPRRGSVTRGRTRTRDEREGGPGDDTYGGFTRREVTTVTSWTSAMGDSFNKDKPKPLTAE